jgi:hypothetical protein
MAGIPRKAKKTSTGKPVPNHLNSGTLAKRIEVGLDYKIVELFSEGLYTSANKAFEELVTNAFDAGACRVNISIPDDRTVPDAAIAVLDDGESMDLQGLEALWKIGNSGKREQATSRGRQPIGKFGIGKLATYVLANELTYICRTNRKYYAVTMDYVRLHGEERKDSSPLLVDVRELTVDEAKGIMSPWASEFADTGLLLFGKGGVEKWTCAILSSLKEKAHSLEIGRLKWILSTALPLRDDFKVFLGRKQIPPSKLNAEKINKWTLGKEITSLSKPAPKGITWLSNRKTNSSSGGDIGFYHESVGTVRGYAEAYKLPLTTGKSSENGRSHGFFVYVYGRLINTDDAYFGISSNSLQHGAFSRFRAVVHIDSLDSELQSSREGIRDGAKAKASQAVLQAVFNWVRPRIQEFLSTEDPASRVAAYLAGSPGSLSRKPIVKLTQATFDGMYTPQLTRVPAIPKTEQGAFIESLAEKVETPSEFIASVELAEDLASTDPVALYDVSENALKVNALHPFVGAFADTFYNQRMRVPLELLSMAEVLLEAQLYQEGFEPKKIKDVLGERDGLLRSLASGVGRRTAFQIAQALADARNDRNRLEEELVASFSSLGFEASHIGGSNNADGIAIAHLGAGQDGSLKKYCVSLEAKSKQRDGDKVAAKTVGVSTIARQRNERGCPHAVVVGPDFPTTRGEVSALARELKEDRATGKTITLIRIDDLAKLVRLAPIRAIGPSRLRDMFKDCLLPEETAQWIEKICNEKVERPPYREVLDAIWREQKEEPNTRVLYPVIRVALRHHDIQMRDTKIREFCKMIQGMTPFISAGEDSVELEVPPDQILQAIESTTNEYPTL